MVSTTCVVIAGDVDGESGATEPTGLNQLALQKHWHTLPSVVRLSSCCVSSRGMFVALLFSRFSSSFFCVSRTDRGLDGVLAEEEHGIPATLLLGARRRTPPVRRLGEAVPEAHEVQLPGRHAIARGGGRQTFCPESFWCHVVNGAPPPLLAGSSAGSPGGELPPYVPSPSPRLGLNLTYLPQL